MIISLDSFNFCIMFIRKSSQFFEIIISNLVDLFVMGYSHLFHFLQMILFSLAQQLF